MLHPNKQFVFAFDLKPEELKKAQRNDTNLFLYGRVQYEDIFKKKHETTFCHGYYQSKKGKTKINHFPMKATHNDAT